LRDLAQANKLLQQEVNKLKDQQELFQNETISSSHIHWLRALLIKYVDAKKQLVQERERKISTSSAAQSGQ